MSCAADSKLYLACSVWQHDGNSCPGISRNEGAKTALATCAVLLPSPCHWTPCLFIYTMSGKCWGTSKDIVLSCKKRWGSGPDFESRKMYCRRWSSQSFASKSVRRVATCFSRCMNGPGTEIQNPVCIRQSLCAECQRSSSPARWATTRRLSVRALCS